MQWKIAFFFVFSLCIGSSVVQARDVCETKVCVERAQQFLESMDTSVDPCTNFYKFSCGQFLEDNNMDQEEDVTSTFTELEAKMQINLRRSLLKINSSDEEIPGFKRQIRQFYDKCMDVAQIERDGMTSLKTLLNFIDGNPNMNYTDFSLERRTWLLTQAGITSDFFFDMDFMPNLQNTTQLVINFSHSSDVDNQSLLKLANALAENEAETETAAAEEVELDEDAVKQIQRYAQLIFTIAKALNWTLTKEEVTQVIVLNQNLLNAAMKIMELKKTVSNLVNVYTVDELQERFKSLNWTEYIRGKTFGLIKETDFDSVHINVMEIEYLDKIMEIIDETDPRIISLYQTIKVVIDHLPRVNKQFRKLNQIVSNSGVLPPPRWKTCLSDVVEEFSVGISYVFVEDHGSEALKNYTIDIISRLKTEFERLMNTSKWFDEHTAQKANDKLNAVVNQIAYSEELLNRTWMESFYQGLNFDNMSYFDSVLQLRKISYIRDVENYLQPDDFSNQVEFVEVAMVNAFYVPFSNSIQIPMGILQGKFVDLGGPLFLNYGSMGFTLAHELSHAFDDFGRQFDLNGNVANWYSDKATEMNNEKEKCIVDQYNNFVDSAVEMNINGANTLSENMADLGGVLIAYYAYKNAPVIQEHDILPLPGLNYTNDQQFWMSFSTTWCSAYRNSKLKNMIEYDLHAPAEYRINGALQNVEEFSRDFNCPAGSPMNPSKKCTVF